MNDSIFTPLQRIKLAEASILTVYELITIIPYRLNKTVYIQSAAELQNLSWGDDIVLSAIISGYSISGGPRATTRITIDTPALGRLLIYSFIPFKFLAKQLNSPDTVYFTLKKAQDFWTLVKMTKLTPSSPVTLSPVYHKNKSVDTKLLKQVFTRLAPSQFVLNTTGLIPESLQPNNTLDLRPLHQPISKEDFDDTLLKWTEFQAFLSLAEIRYFDSKNATTQARGSSSVEVEIEKMIARLPYKLSSSQNSVIQNLLQRLVRIS